MANLVPYTKSSIIKSQKSAIIKADKFLNAKSKSSIIEPKKSAIVKADKFLNAKSTKVNANSVKPKQSENSSEDILLKIEKKVIKIDKLLKDSFALKKKQQKKVRIKGEQKEFEDREKELEKKKPKKEKGVNLPTPPKMGFLDWIKNFITQTVLGFITVRLIKFLPTLLKIYPVIIGAGEFLINVGGNILNSLVSFVDWGYKAVDATSGFIKNIGGEGLSKVFDNFVGAIDNVLEFAVMAALVSSGGDDESDSGGLGGKGGRRGFDSQGRRVGTKVQQRYERRFGKDKFVDRFGTKNLKNVAQGAKRGGLQQGARNAFMGVAGKGGAKSILKFVRPLTNKLPIIGGLLNFGLSVALGEDPGRAAFKAIGSTLVGALGAAIGSLAFGVGGIIGGIIGGIGGDALGGALYDMFFKGKKPTQKQGKTNKLAGGGSPIPSTRGGKSSSSTPTRTLKKKKSARTLTFTPRKIQPGRSAGGEAKIQSVFPNPSKPTPAWWDPLGVFTGKKQEQQPQQKKPKGKTPNSQEFLIKSNDVLGRSKGFGGFATLIIKSLLGDTPDDLDYLNTAKGLNSFMQGIFQPGTLGFSGGGEVDARQFFEGEDYTKIIAKSVKESVSKEVDTTVRNLRNEMSLRPVGKEEMTQENIRRGTEGTEGGDLETAGGAVSASELYKEIGANLEQWDIFRNSVALIESGGRYGTPGGSGKHYDGRYQMGEAAKKDGSKVAGVSYPGHSSDPNAHVRVSFRNNPQLQEIIFTGFTLANHRYLMRNPKYKSASVERKLEILGYAHNQGMGGAETWMNTGVVGADGFGTKGTKYTDLIAKNFKAKRSGGKMQLAQGAVGVPSHPDISQDIVGKVGSFGVVDPTPRSKPGVKGSYGYASDSGLDIIGKTGDSIVSPVSGKLLYAEQGHTSWKDDSNPDKPGYQPQHSFSIQLSKPFNYAGKNIKYVYGTHLSSLSQSVANKSGINIRAGQSIGAMGVANKVPHLHLGLLQNRAQSSESDWLSNKQVKSVLTGSRFHGGEITKEGVYNLHKGEVVIDFDTRNLFGIDLLMDLNSVENKSQLIAKAPSIIEKLKSISGYTDYENPNQQSQIIVIKSPPEIVYVPTGSGGSSNIFIGGGVNSTNNNIEQTLCQIG